MKIREFFELYREPECVEDYVWEFNIDKKYKIIDKQGLLNYPELFDKEMTYFTIVNQIDYEKDVVYSFGGLKVYPKARVYIYTTEYNGV